MIFSSVLVCGLLAAAAAAQSATPRQNNTHNVVLPPADKYTQNTIILVLGSVREAFPLLPLTPEAKNNVPHGPHSMTGILGHLTANSPTTSTALQPRDFAYTNCNSSAYPGFKTLDTVIQDAIQVNVSAIIFYSLYSDYCNLTEISAYKNYTSLYSMQVTKQSQNVATLLEQSSFREADAESIFTLGAYQRYATSQQQSQQYPGAGSTAVAMIILYSITGVITALFLIIITTGAIRAHRHPERYGPRNVLGRPRQSRAKGIARAMLDTLPIVKFGEKETDENKDVEGAENGSSIGLETRAPQPTTASAADGNAAQASADASESQQDTVGRVAGAADTNPRSESAASAEDKTDEALGCSICTDDFERGQDIRVLPCNHKFHPACVDPWLLEVSGTCPLCRVDLHPSEPTDGEAAAPSDELPPPLDPTAADGAAATTAGARRRDTLRGFISARVNRRGLQGASGEERLEILRRYREARRAQTTGNGDNTASTTISSATDTANTAEEESRGENRLSRFSRIMRRRER